MTKTLISDPILEPLFFFFFFFHEFYLYLLDIVSSYHPIQFKGKLIYQTWENGKRKLILGQILANFAQIWAPKFISWGLPPLIITHCSKLLSYAIFRKISRNFRKWQRTLLWPRFWPLCPKIWTPNFFVGFTSASMQQWPSG